MNEIIERFYSETADSDIIPFITKGIVMNANDPQQNGRVQVLIPSLHEDLTQAEIDHLPWASYLMPFGGIDNLSSRGPATQGQNYTTPYGSKTEGFVSYGLWNIPKVGSQVAIFFIDNDPNQLFYFGCFLPNSTAHTMPHGRYLTDVPGGELGPEGPLSSTEQPIEPLHTNSKKAFRDHNNFEWRTRGADYSVAAISPERVIPIESDSNESHTGVVTKILDDRDVQITEEDGNIFGKDLKHRQGYALSKVEPTKNTQDDYHKQRDKDTDRNLESTVFSWTTPGFHSISMDDRPENCRMRFRTASGHQIILDDSNERIYVSTSEGRNWVEMDSDGHIYIFSEESISMRAQGDVNITAEKTVRIKGNEGIHLQTPKEMRFHAVEDIHVIGEADMFTTITGDKHTHILSNEYTTIDEELHEHVISNVFGTYDANVDIQIGGELKQTVTGDIHSHSNANIRSKADGDTVFESGGNYSISASNIKVDTGGNLDVSATVKSGGDIVSGGNVTASNGQDLAGLNNHTHQYNPGASPLAPTQPFSSSGGSASSSAVPWGGDDAAVSTDSINAEHAYWTNITPEHEPWGRSYMTEAEINIDHVPELNYTDPLMGKNMKRSGVEDDRKRNPLWHR